MGDRLEAEVLLSVASAELSTNSGGADAALVPSIASNSL